MSIRVVRLGTRRLPGEGLRIGTVRRPPRGVRREQIASRDFYDVWLLSRHFDFDGAGLAWAITATFDHRDTALTDTPVALTAAFAESPTAQTQWAAFVRKGKLDDAPKTPAQAVEAISAFLGPVTQARSS